MVRVDIMLKCKVATYIRLSKADNYIVSNSINNQKEIIKKYISCEFNSEKIKFFVTFNSFCVILNI